jgi:hypothetical protein
VPDGAVRDKHSTATNAVELNARLQSAGGVREEIGGRSTQECLANSRANFFAAADLTLMRSLRVKTPKNKIKRRPSSIGQIPTNFTQSFDLKSPLQDCQQK